MQLGFTLKLGNIFAMAGSPKKKSLKVTVAAIGIGQVLDRIANGETITAMAVALGTSPPMLSALLNCPEHTEAYARARERRAARHVERIETMADDVELGALDPTAARVSIDARKWVAARLDPGRWAESKGPLVNITLTDLHLGSLRRVEPDDTKVIDG